MKHLSAFLLFVGMSPALFAAFSETEARQVYDAASVSFPPQQALPSATFREEGAYVFVEVRWACAESPDAEGEELALLLDALERYLTQGLNTSFSERSPFGPTLTEWMAPEVEYRLNGIPQCTLSDKTAQKVRTKVFAYEGAALRAERTRIQALHEKARRRTEAEWGEGLRRAFVTFQEAGKRSQFFMLLGCPIVNLMECGELGAPLSDGATAYEELAAWRASLKRADSFYARHPALSAENLKSGFFFPQWQTDDGGRLEEGKRLYAKGQNPDRILQLLAESLAINPISAEKWGYLGGTLKIKGLPNEAIFAYMQALRYDKRMEYAWKGLCESCENANLKANAKGLRWLLKTGLSNPRP